MDREAELQSDRYRGGAAYGGPMKVAVPRDVSTTQALFNELCGVTENLEKQVSMLHERLQPVLAPAPSASQGARPDRDRDIIRGAASVTDQLRQQIARVNALTSHVEHLRDTLEI